ncbi:MAG TPA: 1-deoxy-D-xylulose-5-phosphate reductoisomerase [bacterium]|jgi:1-deoxy-D-xylulose-5-phosphate reductoisomerase|nr:1-deoxy-D-xylulose-5-phosphate reductoisomerase [bacterium]
MPRPKRIAILGSTGSVGQSALSVAAHLKDEVRVTGLAAGSKAAELWRQAKRTRAMVLGLADEAGAAWLRSRVAAIPKAWAWKPKVHGGPQALERVAESAPADLVLSAVVGSVGLKPTLLAIAQGRDIALANKETLVAAGELVSGAARRKGVRLLPVDSEHNAIFQCLEAVSEPGHVKRLVLTASGGPFRGASLKTLKAVGPKEALRHPTWAMGPKISIDSATLMNKGLEVIEAHWLFKLPYQRIDVVVHPQSIIHSMVETVDGSLLAQLGPTDMRLPIQHSFTWPQRRPHAMPALDLLGLPPLTFEAPDTQRFPCLALAYKAGRMGGAAAAALNAANEAAVEAFLKGRLSFLGIARTLALVLDAYGELPAERRKAGSLEQVLAADAWGRAEAARRLAGARP